MTNKEMPPDSYRRKGQLSKVDGKYLSAIDSKLYDFYEETPEYHNDSLQGKRWFIERLTKDAEADGQAVFLLEAGYGFGTLTLSGIDEKETLGNVYPKERMEPQDWEDVIEDEEAGYTPLVVDAKRITKGSVSRALPAFLDKHYPELGKLPFVVYDSDDTGYEQYLDRFDFTWTQKQIDQLVKESVKNQKVKLSYWNEFDEQDFADISIEGHTRHYTKDGRWHYSSECLVTAYGRQYLPEFEKEGIEEGPKHFVLDTNLVTEKSLQDGLQKFFAQYYPNLIGVPLELTNENEQIKKDLEEYYRKHGKS